MPYLVLACVLLAVVTGPAFAQQLTYHTRIEIRTLQPDPVDPRLDRVIDEAGRELRQLVLARIEGGSTDYTIMLGNGAVRVEHASKGTVEIIRNDGDAFVLNPKQKTYWALPSRRPSASLPGLSARLLWKRTGQFDMIAGVRAEQIVFEVAMIPADERFATRLGEPVTFDAHGEVWVAPQYGRHARMAAAVAPQVFSVFPTLAELGELGTIMRSTIASELFGAIEIASVVTDISETALMPSLYDVPRDYRRVPPALPEGYEAPQILSRSPVSYPTEAARNKIDGDVLLLVAVAADGSVRSVRILKGLGHGLDEAAIKSVREWRYKPARKDGRPIDSELTISVGFTYRERPR